MEKFSRQDQTINHIFITTIVLYSLIIAFLMPLKSAFASEHIPDEHTLFLLHFNGDLSSAVGDTPTHAVGVTFEEGLFGTGAYFPVGNQLFYDSLNNIDSTEGTLESWIKPRWNGDDGNHHYLLKFGLWGGMLLGKDSGNFWRCIFNRWVEENGTVYQDIKIV